MLPRCQIVPIRASLSLSLSLRQEHKCAHYLSFLRVSSMEAMAILFVAFTIKKRGP